MCLNRGQLEALFDQWCQKTMASNTDWQEVARWANLEDQAVRSEVGSTPRLAAPGD